MQYLRYATAVIISVGPFLDKTDGVTLETGLTITNERITLVAETDDGSAPTNVLDNVTGATSGTSNDLNYITGNDAAMMQLELSAANTTRLGRMRLIITDAANHCPVFHEFTVIPAAIYDAMFSAGASFGDVAVNTTIATLASQTSFTLTDGSADNTAYGVGAMVVVRDATTKTQLARGILSAYTGSTKTVTLAADPGIFTMAVGDTVQIILQPTQIGTASATAGSLITAGTGTNQLSVASGLVKPAANSITSSVIAANAIGASQIASDAIAAAKIATGAITSAKFAAGAIDAAAIANNAIDAATFAADVDAEILSYIVDDATRIDASALNTANVTTTPAISTAVAALQTYPKNVAVSAFMFYMEDADGAAVTGATVSCFISKDGGAFAATATATATEVSSGWYKVALTQTEANCDELAFRATATGARTCNMKVRMQG